MPYLSEFRYLHTYDTKCQVARIFTNMDFIYTIYLSVLELLINL